MKKPILLVDDEPHILETAADILEAAGFTVYTAETGALALESLQAHAPALMIVDFNLLDMTGVEVAQKAKALAPGVQIILMSGEATVDLGPAKDLVRMTLTKPVNPPQLIDIIRKIVEA